MTEPYLNNQPYTHPYQYKTNHHIAIAKIQVPSGSQQAPLGFFFSEETPF